MRLAALALALAASAQLGCRATTYCDNCDARPGPRRPAEPPLLTEHLTHVTSYRLDARCSQGPIAISLPALGLHHGEGLKVKLHSPRKLRFKWRYELKTAQGRYRVLGTFNRGTTARTLARLHGRCRAMAGEPDRAPAGGPSKPAVPTAEGAASGDAGGAAKAKTSPSPSARDLLVEVKGPLRRRLAHVYEAGWSAPWRGCKGCTCGAWQRKWASRRPPRGTKLQLVIWSDRPLDFDGVQLDVYRVAARPARGAKHLARHLAAQAKACAAAGGKPGRAAPRDLLDREMTWIVVLFSRPGFLKYGVELRKPRRCWRNPRSTRCWGKKGYFAVLKQLRASLTDESKVRFTALGKWHTRRMIALRCVKPTGWGDASCWGAGGYRAWRARAVKAQRAVAKKRRVREAEWSAPPAPRVEKRPPKPSTNALWIAGYWLRSGVRWHWIAGWWRVPTADIERGRTARTRKAPPPKRVTRRRVVKRRPPKPLVRAVWAPGHWRWDGRIYVWVPGAWRIPPSARHVWRRARWRRRGGLRIFIPGGWTVRIGI